MAKAAYFSEGDGDEGRAECWGLSVVAASPVPPHSCWGLRLPGVRQDWSRELSRMADL